MEKEKWGTVVIGAAQAGLSTGYYLREINEDFLIIDEGTRIGDSWRRRWDSLMLFTPAEHDGLPGFPFPATRGACPTKEEMAHYLDRYAQKFSLPVQLNTKVIELSQTEDGFRILTTNGQLQADKVIVCTGTNPVPYIPDFAKELDKDIIQIHSSGYKNPQSFSASNTLVVGAGTSGVEIAIELSASRPTMISGHPTPHIPDFLTRYAGNFYWWAVHNVLTISTPIGRKVRQKIIKGGGPLIRVSFDDVKAAGVEHLPRVSGVKGGLPQLADDRVISVSSIVWATGFRPDFSWIRMNVTDETGWPKTSRGISGNIRGLYFVGMLFQYGLTSGLVGGVGRDAAFVVNHLGNRK
jgi:putative flavoprotein involved in K+ transport